MPTLQIDLPDPKRETQNNLILPGPGHYDPEVLSLSRNKSLVKKNKSVGFNSQAPRFKN